MVEEAVNARDIWQRKRRKKKKQLERNLENFVSELKYFFELVKILFFLEFDFFKSHYWP